ncbi:MAG: hypothetical protein CL748_04360 [Chloroflexi bacterium]|nr:hypothetical protein [Chloroflexota bacterium]
MQISDLSKRKQKIIKAWCMYDWANSAFATSGVAAIFPIYFVAVFQDAFGDEASFLGMTFTPTSTWSFGIAISTALVAFASPILGVLADRIPIKKTLLLIYTFIGSLFTILVFFGVYTNFNWAWVMGSFFMGNIGFAGAIVIYNSFLPNIAPDELQDDVSGIGFAYGYVGGGLLLLMHAVLIFIFQDTSSEDLITRLSISSIGLWWFGWSIWTLRVIPEPKIEKPIVNLRISQVLNLSVQELSKTAKNIKKFKSMMLYLGSYLLFNDGIQTILAIAGAYAADTLGLPLMFAVVTILLVQFTAAIGSLMFNKLSRIINTKNALLLSLIIWTVIVIFAISITPLKPNKISEFDYNISYSSGQYIVDNVPSFDSDNKSVNWNKLILENKIYTKSINIGDSLTLIEANNLLTFVSNNKNSEYSIIITGGQLDNMQSVGDKHPSSLGKGSIDWWPNFMRENVWYPLGLSVEYQWLLLGTAVGLVMGGSQALARSLFSKITPKHRTAEFFSFFGFAGKASSVIGPMIFVAVSSAMDARVAIMAVCLLIIVGTISLKLVNVEDGIKAAKNDEDLYIKSL